MRHPNISRGPEADGWKFLLDRILSHCERSGKQTADFLGAVWANVFFENDVPVRISAQFAGNSNGTEQITLYLDASGNVDTMRSVRSFDKFFENGALWGDDLRCIHSNIRLIQDFDSFWMSVPSSDFELPEDFELVIQSQTIAWRKETRFAQTHLFYAFDEKGDIVPRSGDIGEHPHFPNEETSFVREVLVDGSWTKSVRPEPSFPQENVSDGIDLDSVVEWKVPYSVELRSKTLDIYLGWKKVCDFEVRDSFDFATLEERFFPKTKMTKTIIEAVATRMEDSVSR